MENTRDENSRLEAIVRDAINLSRNSPVERKTETKDSPDRKYCDSSGFTFEAYKAGVEQDIKQHLISTDIRKQIRERLIAAKLGNYMLEDYESAIDLANALILSALLAESSYGDRERAEKELESEFPGFSKPLYGSLIGWFGYINR